MIRRNPSGVLLIVSGKRTKYLMMENEILGRFSEFCRFQKSRFKNTFSFNCILLRNIAKGTLSTLTHSTTLYQSSSFNNFEILVKLQLDFVSQRARKHRTTLTYPYNKFEKSMHQFGQIHVTS